jgi:2-polyprenyl-3-methyl-5-hydroxy-6-metoxy-1,4-benzoquinol methylase
MSTRVAPKRLTPPALLEMMQAYKTTALLTTGIELGVFGALADGRSTSDAIASRLGISERGSRLLLNALAALGLVESNDGEFSLPEGAADLLVPGGRTYVGGMAKVMSGAREWDAMLHLADAVRRGEPVVGQHAETPGFDYWEDFATYAGAVAGPMGQKVSDLLGPWAEIRAAVDILDVACGHGLYGFTVAKNLPQARVWSLDWENVLPIARRNAERLGLGGRAAEISGDMFTVDLGGPYDVVLITNVLHHFSESRGIELLKRAAGVLKPDGRLVLVGFTVGDEPPAQDPAPHLFSILMLVWTAKGEVHPVAAYDRMLAASGFRNADVHHVPQLPLKVLIAQPRD